MFLACSRIFSQFLPKSARISSLYSDLGRLELGKCKDLFNWPTLEPGWADEHIALVDKKVAELRQTWAALSDDDLLDLLDELPDYPEDEVEAQW